MADKNIQMTRRNAANTDWDNIYPNTKAENVVANDGTTTFESHLAENVQSFIDTSAAVVAMGASKTKEVNTASAYARAIEEIKIACMNGLKQSQKSINENGTLKVACIGTSISETSGLTNANDGYFARVQKQISDILLPAGVTVTAQNFALSGRTMALAASTTFVAVNPEPSDIAQGFWRWWATAGKSWRDHVKDFTPDLLIIEFGMNDSVSTDSDYNFYNNLNTFVAYVKTWTKVPDIIIVPTILPTKNTSYYGQSQVVTNAVARAAREYGKHNGCIVADVNRLWQILRDGKDEVTRATSAELNFTGYPTGWVGSTSSFTLADNTLTPTSGLTAAFVGRARNYHNGIIEMDVNPTNAVAWITYRVSSYGKMALLITPGAGNAQISLYAIASTSLTIAAKTGLTIPSGEFTKIKIESNGIHHKVYVAGVLQIDTTTYKCLHEGTIEIGASSGLVATFKNLKIEFHDPLAFNPIFTELELLGAYNDLVAEGNGINHPTPLGNALAFVSAFGFLSDLAAKKEVGMLVPTRIGSASWIATSSPFPTTTSVGEKIYYKSFVGSNYRKDRGITLRRLDNNSYYTLSTAAVSMDTLANLEPGKFCYYADGANDLIFISVPAAGAVTWDIDCYKYI